jgi:hypothetical protein
VEMRVNAAEPKVTLNEAAQYRRQIFAMQAECDG